MRTSISTPNICSRKRIAHVIGCLLGAGSAGDVSAQDPGLSWYGGFTLVSLDADDDRISADQTLSADLFALLQGERGRWFFYLEANSSLESSNVSTVIPEANADAATAIDPDGGGRIQLSEINYRFSLQDGGGLTAGLIDPTAYLDRSRITNDENVQFLGTSFVNNPTIGFPDYTLGLVYERPRTPSFPQLNAVLTSATGLADNSSLSYSELVELDGDNDGAFAAISLGWPSERRLVRAGAWINTRPHRALAEQTGNRDRNNYGAYLVYGLTDGPHGLNVRMGLANDAVSRAARFAALAYRYQWRQHALGAGVSHTVLSGAVRGPGFDDTTHFEVFGRFTIGGRVHLTASLQSLLHSGFVASGSDPRDRVTLAGLRFHYSF